MTKHVVAAAAGINFAAGTAPKNSSGEATAAARKQQQQPHRLSTVRAGNYQMTRLLGKGNFAKVYEAVHTVLKTKVAVKVIDTNKINQEYVIKNLTREAKLLSMLHHQNIVKLYETIQCGGVYYLVIELATGGDLCTHVRNQPSGRLDEATARIYARQLAAALQHMHSRDIVHRDLKMENVMLFDKRKELIKIVDFGLSNIYNDENPMRTQCGSPEYAAPELFVKNYKYGPEVDLWSLGVILYVVCSGRLPFLCPKDGQVTLEERRRRLLAQINHGLGPHQERAIIALSSEYKHLVSRLLTPATNKRMGLTELCQHPWIAGCKFFKNHSSQKKFNQLKRDHHTVIEEIIGLANLNRDAIEINVANKRYGKVGGMYNILMHKIESDCRLTEQQSLLNTCLKRAYNQTNSNVIRNKFVQSKLNNIVTEKCTRKAKTSNDLEVKTDNTTKNEVNKALNKTIPLKTHKVFMRRKNKITNFQPTENKPMTQPCSKKSLTCAPYMSSKSFRSQKQPHLAISSREKPTITEERTNKGSLRKSRLTNSISSPIKTSFWQSQDMDCCRNDVQSTITYRLVGDKYNMDPVKRKELCCNVLKKSKFSDTKEVHTKNINNCKNSRDIFSGLEKMKRKNKISCLGSHTTEVQTYRDVKIHHLNTKLKFCKSFKNHTSSFRIDNKTD